METATATRSPVARGPVTASNRRRLLGLLAALAALAVLVLVGIAVGSRDIPLTTVVDALLHDTGEGDAYVVWSLRVPRTAVLLAVGIALGVAGMLIQALTRNPLADPGILGVNAGAALFVALGIAVFEVSSPGGYVWFAFLGAFLVTVVVYLIGSAGRAGIDPIQLTLAGVTLGAMLFAVVSALTLLNPRTFEQMRNWNAGSVVGRGWEVLLPVLPFLVVGVLLAVAVAGPLNAIALGDDLAKSLGAHIGRTRVVVVLAVTLLAGGATAVAGPIGFVGLMVPHVARWIVGPDQRWILGATLLLAPSLLLAADIVGRTVIRPGELPVGIVMAFVGAPILILLVRRRKTSGL
ncbi:FecCD family ABC transporter permease [Pseudonocardia abyssalis]|uniref:Iron chelate uptake ABC transporter family permease subunit n=1 Tax=Pseudonocardia abyssalis TaxID=2792008 RepID=A0ABS6UWD2_9PSEU|nr:iron chelate uptake ABC transporter family permease subunit [Pseudonocardia abyssalis]MBW0114772.1 iron chelate uptake ABC transporter family permease subunit [Pseudonocardia abyssalis]MBW0136286.1 iron chelate uptake ABC transporter family permease subunit [Pseudonocardia abyssalis]